MSARKVFSRVFFVLYGLSGVPMTDWLFDIDHLKKPVKEGGATYAERLRVCKEACEFLERAGLLVDVYVFPFLFTNNQASTGSSYWFSIFPKIFCCE